MLIEVEELNELLSEGHSFRAICKTRNVARSTLQGQLRNAGYVLKNNQYVLDSDNIDEGGREISTDIGTATLEHLETLDGMIESINRKLFNITHDFTQIAFYLNKIYAGEMFKDKGYSSIVDFANSEFGLSKNQTYNFLRIANEFMVPGTYCLLKDEYENYNFSQLVELISLPESSRKEVDSNMTVKEIREKKKQIKENKEDVQEQLEGQQTFVEAEFEHVQDVKQEINQIKDIDYKKEYEALKDVFEKRSTRLRDKEKELIELRAKLDTSNEIESKVDLSLAISVLETAWSNEADDNKANELRKQIDYIRSLN